MKTFAIPMICLSAFCLFGCAGHNYKIVAEEPDWRVSGGWFKHDGGKPAAMMLEFKGLRYESIGFTISRTQNLAQLRKLYGPGKHYDSIFSGLDSDHYVYSANPDLGTVDGKAMNCSVVWRDGIAPAGKCETTEGEHINVRFE